MRKRTFFFEFLEFMENWNFLKGLVGFNKKFRQTFSEFINSKNKNKAHKKFQNKAQFRHDYHN